MANLQKTLVESQYDILLAARTNEYVLVDFVYEPEEMVVTYPIIDYVSPSDSGDVASAFESETAPVEQNTSELPQPNPTIELARVSITLPGQRLAHMIRTKVELQSGQVQIEELIAKYKEVAQLNGLTVPESIIIDPRLFEVESAQQQSTETEDYWSQVNDNPGYEDFANEYRPEIPEEPEWGNDFEQEG
jgi:hypothetical protein